MSNNHFDAKRPRSQSDAAILASFSRNRESDPEAFLEALAKKVSSLPAPPDVDTGWWCTHQTLMKELLPYLADDLSEERSALQERFRSVVADQISNCRQSCIQYHKAVFDYEMEDGGDVKVIVARIRALLNWDVERLLPKLRRLAKQISAIGLETNPNGFSEKYALLETMLNFRISVRREISEIIGEIISKATPLDMKDIVPVVKKVGAIPSGLLALCFHQKPAVSSWAERLCTQLVKICRPHRESAFTLLQKVAKQLERSNFIDAAKGGSSGYAPDKRTGWHGFGTIFGCLNAKAVVDLCSRCNPNRLFKLCVSAVTDSDDEVVIRSTTCLLRLFEFVSSDRLFTSESTPHLLLQHVCNSFRQGRRRLAQRKLLDIIAPTISKARKIYDHKGVCRLFQIAIEFLCKEARCDQQSGSELMAYTSMGSTDRASLDRSAVLKSGARLLEAFYSHTAPSLPLRNSTMISNFVLTALREETDSDCSWDLLRVVMVTDAFNLLRILCSPGDAREVATVYPLRRADSLMSTGQEAKVVESFKEMQLSEEREDFWVLPLWKSLHAGTHSTKTDIEERVSEREVRLLLDLHMVIGMVNCAHLDDVVDRNICAAPIKDGRLGTEISRTDASRLSASDRLSVMQNTISVRFFLACQNSGAQKWWSVLPFHATHLLASARREISQRGFAALRKSKNILGASCFGSQSKLLASVVKDDSVSAKMMADGCYAAMRIIGALGNHSSIRAFPSVMLWYRVLLESTYNDLFNSGDQTCAVGVIVVFATNWKQFEKCTEESVFREVCCRLFTNLRDVWDRLILSESTDDDENYMNVDGRRDGLRKALYGIIGMHRLQDNFTRGAWVNLICSVGESWRTTFALREQMVIAVQYHESNRKMLTYEQCKRITEAGGLSEVHVNMHRWSKDQESKMAQRDSKPRKQVTTTIDQFFGSAPQADRMVRAVVEKKNSNTPFIGKGFASREALSIRPPTNIRSLKMPGQSSTLLELRRDMKAMQRSKVKRDIRTTTRAPSAEGGKTAFELLVAKNQAEKKTRMAAESRRGTIEIVEKTTAGTSKCNAALPTSTQRTHVIALDVFDSEELEIEAAKKRFSLPISRRHLLPRELEQVYRSILSSPGKVTSLPNADFVKSSRPSYVDIEEYVSYWEPFVMSEFRSSVQKAISEEEILWDRESRKSSFSPWRASFKVNGAVESIGYVQHISVLYCDDESLLHPKGKSSYSDYEVSRIQASDLVLLFIPPPKFAKKTAGKNDTFSALGLVMNVVRKSSEFSLTLKVAFERLDKVPGNGRQIQVIRLVGTTTFQRQMDALWRLPRICNGVLRPILSPREGIDINKAVCKEQMRLFSDAAASRFRFLDEMRSGSHLNDSQKGTISEVLKSCSPLFRAQEAGALRSDHVADHGSLTMIQGPPGTGKTSTIIALISALLLPRAQNQPYKNVRIGFDNTFAVMRVPKLRILVCAPSNAAVDEMMLRVVEDGLLTPGGFRATPMMVRVGGGTTNEALKAFEVWEIVDRRMGSNGQSGNQDSKPQERIKSLQLELARINSKIGETSKKRENCDSRDNVEIRKGSKGSGQAEETYSELTEQLTALHNRKRAINNMLSATRSAVRDTNAAHKSEQTRAAAGILNGCSVVFATLSSSGHDLMRTAGARFDIIIVDEAAQCCEPELIIPVTSSNSAKKHNIPASHLILVGDPKQLPATVLSADRAVQRALGSSLFERVASNSIASVHMLCTQYRMHPAISAFPSTHFYNGRLVNGENVCSKTIHQSFHLDKQLRFGPLSFFDTSRTNAMEVRTAAGSLCNSAEAIIIISAVTSLVRLYRNENFTDKIVILSPYKQQVNLLKRLLSENKTLKGIAVEVSTIDGIQGREKSIVFLSTVRSGHGRGIGFVDDDRRINVAITRAKHSLIVFGHSAALSQGSRLWDSLIAHCRSRSLISTLPVEAKHFFPESAPEATVPAAPRLPPLRELANADDSGRMKLESVTRDALAHCCKPARSRGIKLRSQLPDPTPSKVLQHGNEESLREKPFPNELGCSGDVHSNSKDPNSTLNARPEVSAGNRIDSSSTGNAVQDQVHSARNPLMRFENSGEKPFVRVSSQQAPADRRAALPSAVTRVRPNVAVKAEIALSTESSEGGHEMDFLNRRASSKEKLLIMNAPGTEQNYSACRPGGGGLAGTTEVGKAHRGGDNEILGTAHAKTRANRSNSRANGHYHESHKASPTIHPSGAGNTSLRRSEKSEVRSGEFEHGSGKHNSQVEVRNEGIVWQVQKEETLTKVEARRGSPSEQVQSRTKSILERLGNRSSQPYLASSRKHEPSPDQCFELIRDENRQSSDLRSKLDRDRSRKGHRRSNHRLEEVDPMSKKGIPPQSSDNYTSTRVPQYEGSHMHREMVGSRIARPPSGQGGHLREPHRSTRVRTERPRGPTGSRQATQHESALRSRSGNLNRRPDRAAIESRLIADSKGRKRRRASNEVEMNQKKRRLPAQPNDHVRVQSQRNQDSNRTGIPPLARMAEQMRQTNTMRRVN